MISSWLTVSYIWIKDDTEAVKKKNYLFTKKKKSIINWNKYIKNK